MKKEVLVHLEAIKKCLKENNDFLDEIIRKTKEDLEKERYTSDWLGRSLAFNPFMPRDVKPYLKATPENPYRIIAEVKKQAQVRVSLKDFDPILIAKAYEQVEQLPFLYLPNLIFFKNLEYLTQIEQLCSNTFTS